MSLMDQISAAAKRNGLDRHLNHYVKSARKTVMELSENLKEGSSHRRDGDTSSLDHEAVEKQQESWESDAYEAGKRKIKEARSRIETFLTSSDTPHTPHTTLKEERISLLEKMKVIRIMKATDGTRLIRIKGFPFAYILDPESGRDSGKIMWRISRKIVPYIMETAISSALNRHPAGKVGKHLYDLVKRFRKQDLHQ